MNTLFLKLIEALKEWIILMGVWLYSILDCCSIAAQATDDYSQPPWQNNPANNDYQKESPLQSSDGYHNGTNNNWDASENGNSRSPILFAPPSGGDPIGGIYAPVGNGTILLISMATGYFLYKIRNSINWKKWGIICREYMKSLFLL